MKKFIQTRTIKGPFGPHAAKKEFFHGGGWHFLKWVSRQQLNNTQQEKGNKNATIPNWT